MKKNIYLDYNSTTPVDPSVVNFMLPFLTQNFGNPSSSHSFGIAAKQAVLEARKKIAGMIHCKPDEIIFTSGGSESNNYAIKGFAFANRNKGNHIITSSIEHPAVLEVCRFLEGKGFEITYLPVDHYGFVNPADVEKNIRPDTILISIMHANNEVGTIQPLKEISVIANANKIAVHSDCAQSVGKIPVFVDELGIDLLSIAGHKMYAPKGVGALFIRTGVFLEKQIHGANHEMNLRAGTENVPEIAALGEAAELINNNLWLYSEKMKEARDFLENLLMKNFPELKINGHPVKCLPNTLNVSFKNIEANLILAGLKNVAASAGAACHSESIDVSHVLKEMKIPVEFAMGSIRFSVGRNTTKEEIDLAVGALVEVVGKLNQPKFEKKIETTEKIKLTEYTSGLGCACKMRPQILDQVLKNIPLPLDENILVGINTSDDAAVYKINEEIAVVQTVDFFTPIVDDPFEFGAIAAANSLSDIYAMGAKPIFALNIAAFPANRLPVEVLDEIIKGANYSVKQAGISIIGGHTIDDNEPKFGLVVSGIIHPQKIIKNCSAKPGDSLILTKPIGTGIYSTALKMGLLNEKDKIFLTEVMMRLNKNASEVMRKIGVSACTDITGFGLIGHLLEMAKSSNITAVIENNKIPLFPSLNDFVLQKAVPGGTKNNFIYTDPFVKYDLFITENEKLILNDAQTSGGLLISVPSGNEAVLLKELEKVENLIPAVIGKVVPPDEYMIRVT